MNTVLFVHSSKSIHYQTHMIDQEKRHEKCEEFFLAYEHSKFICCLIGLASGLKSADQISGDLYSSQSLRVTFLLAFL